jgi:hypothetical protein
MKFSAEKESPDVSAAAKPAFCLAEETLRTIAVLPAPIGLEERLQAGLRRSLQSGSRGVRIFSWPSSFYPGRAQLRAALHGATMRAALAASIALAVAGGGWEICSRVQYSQPSRAVVLPPRVSSSAGFSSAGAMRTPQTLIGPLTTPAPRIAASAPVAADAAQARRGSRQAAAVSGVAGTVAPRQDQKK